ncbi:hypothetical protein HOE04_02525 [archaeon]|nr:hypothetical protein [archaeon]
MELELNKKKFILLVLLPTVIFFNLFLPFVTAVAEICEGCGVFMGTNDTVGTDFNADDTYSALKWSTQDYDDNHLTYSAGNPTRIEVDTTGDYFIALNLPLIDLSYSGSNDQRAAIEAAVYVDGTIVPVGTGRGSYMRGTDGSYDHFQTGSNLNVLVPDVSAGSYIEIYVRGVAETNEAIGANDMFALYVEYIQPEEEIFFATGTTSTAPSSNTDLNQDATWAYDMEWTEYRKDSTFTHDDVTDSNVITLADIGYYYVTVNIPQGAAATRSNVGGRVELDDTIVDGGTFMQGYIRNTDSPAHQDSSVHWAGLVETTSTNQDLTIGINRMTSTTTTITTDGLNATVYVKKIANGNTGLFHSITTNVTGAAPDDWNPATTQYAIWSTDNEKDTDYYTHTNGEENITVLQEGYYLISFNSPQTVPSGLRSHPQYDIRVNGATIDAGRTGSSYMRDSGGHDESTTMITYFANLSAGDNVSISVVEGDSTLGSTVSDADEGVILIEYKEKGSNVEWSIPTLDMGAKLQANGNITGYVNVTASGDQNEVNVTCESGNCTEITSNWTNGIDMTNGQIILTEFTCSNSTIGSLSAYFNITSLNDTEPNQINGLCIISNQQTVIWNQTSFDLGNVYDGMETNSNASFDVAGTNEDITINELEGDGISFMSTIPTYVGTLAGGSNQEVLFNCSPPAGQSPGEYQVIYNVNSTEDSVGSNITINCTIAASTAVWDLATLDLGNVYSGNSVNLDEGIISTGFNVDVAVSELGGDGISFMSANTSSIGNMTDGSSYEVKFTCSPPEDQAAGSYNAIYNVNTTHNATGRNITVSCDVLAALIEWNQSSLDVGYGNLNEGNFSTIIKINSTGISNNTEVNCVSGDCSVISQNYANGVNFSDGDFEVINFTCDDAVVGSYSANFKVNSTQNAAGDTATITCKIYQTYSLLNISLLAPNISEITNVTQDQTFWVNATVNCVGTVGSFCGNISGVVRDNSTNPFGDGSEGELNVTYFDTVINNYTYLTINASIGTSNINISNASEFSPGDEILIIQIQNYSGGMAGTYEFVTISSIDGQNITLNRVLENNYYTGVFNQTNATVSQIVKIPHYTDVNINGSIVAPAWNGYIGGIVAFKANGSINFTGGSVNVSERGYRGGDCNGGGNSAWGDQGEGFLGLGIGTLDANANGGGGGYGPSGYNGEPGAGGGHGTAGGIGDSTDGYPSDGGSVAGTENLNLIFFGGGAGGGGDNDGCNPFPEYVDGGGIAIVIGNKIINATINVDGEKGIGNISCGGSGGSGGGAGGTVWLRALNITINNVSALGKLGGVASDDTGGAGGDGRIRLDFITFTGNSPDPVSGYNGTLENMYQINESSGNPFYSISSQSQDCGYMDSSSSTCQLNWSVNATGNSNSLWEFDVLFFSNISQVNSNNTNNSIVRILAGAAIDTCTPTAGNWEIDCSDNCVKNTDFTVPDNITMTGSGTLTLNANMTFTKAHWKIYKEDNCEIIINPGGSIK